MKFTSSIMHMIWTTDEYVLFSDYKNQWWIKPSEGSARRFFALNWEVA